MTNEFEHRIAELETALRHEREEKERYKDAAFCFLKQIVPYTPITDEEIDRLISDTAGTPILDIVAEYERSAA